MSRIPNIDRLTHDRENNLYPRTSGLIEILTEEGFKSSFQPAKSIGLSNQLIQAAL